MGSHTVGLQDTEDLVTCRTTTVSISRPSIIANSLEGFAGFKHTSDNLDLSNTVGVTEDDTNLGGGSTLLSELADLVDDLLGGGLEPRGGVARVGDRGGRDALALGVKTAHFG